MFAVTALFAAVESTTPKDIDAPVSQRAGCRTAFSAVGS
jgi:hypothetical protein